MPVIIREFRRPDRDQLTELVNRHVATVLPGVALSTNVVLSQLEGEPGELIVNPWVAERHCLVALDSQAVVAAALIYRFGNGDEVREGYRGAAELRWFIVDPASLEAGRTLLGAVVALAKTWDPSHFSVEQSLPAPACLGISDSWPHLRRLLTDAGFVGPSRIELALAHSCRDLQTSDGQTRGGEPHGGKAQLDKQATVRRSVGSLGVRLDLMVDRSSIGYVEVGDMNPALARSTAGVTWTDVGNLFAVDPADLPLVMPTLLSAAATWLSLGGVDRLIDYYAPDVHAPEYLAILHRLGFTVLSTNERGWELPLGDN